MIDSRPVFFIVGILLAIMAALMVLPAAVDLAAGNPDWAVFATTAALTLFVGVSLIIANHGTKLDVQVREAFLLTAVAWTVAAAAGALPLFFSNLDLSVTDAFFEAASGITTTGATVIVGLDTAPPGILLWRSLLQMLGGIGFMVLAVAVLPFLKVGGMQLFRLEFTDKSEKALPRVAQVASGIAVIYVCLIAIDATILWFLGMTGFEAVNHAMTTVATAGFSTSDQSIGHFNSVPIEVVTTIFMLLGGLPFVRYLEFVRGQPGRLWQDSQIRGFLGLYAVAVLVLVLWRWLESDEPFGKALIEVTFNVASVMTTTGYATTHYEFWGAFATFVLLCLMVVGACAGSTAGGMKIYRLETLYVTAKTQIRSLVQPHALIEPHYAGKALPEAVVNAVLGYFFLFSVSFVVLALALGAMGLDFLTATSGVASALANVGPGLGPVIGPEGNFSTLPDGAKWLLSLGMLAGRLELYTMIVLLVPAFWRG